MGHPLIFLYLDLATEMYISVHVVVRLSMHGIYQNVELNTENLLSATDVRCY